jgi:Helicase associated domain
MQLINLLAVIKEDTDPTLNFDASPDFASTNSQRPALKQARQRLNDAQWNDMYVRLADYKEKYGDTLVPKKYESDPKLGRFCREVAF